MLTRCKNHALHNNKRPDGTTLLPWQEESLWPGMWEYRTLMQSPTLPTQLSRQVQQPKRQHSAQKKTDKYAELSNTRILLSLCRGNSWCVAWDGDRADTRDRQTHHHSHRIYQGNHFLVTMPFYDSSERECGRLPEHHDYQMKRRCIHYNFSYFNIIMPAALH